MTECCKEMQKEFFNNALKIRNSLLQLGSTLNILSVSEIVLNEM